MHRYPNAIPISARSGLGIANLEAAVSDALSRSFLDLDVEFGVENGRMLAYLAANGEVLSKTFHDTRVVVHCRISQHFLSRMENDGVVVRGHEENNGKVLYSSRSVVRESFVYDIDTAKLRAAGVPVHPILQHRWPAKDMSNDQATESGEYKEYAFWSSWEGEGRVFVKPEGKPRWTYKSVGLNNVSGYPYGFFWLPAFVVQDSEGRELLSFNRTNRFVRSTFEVKEGDRVIGTIRQESFLWTKYTWDFGSGQRCTFRMPLFTAFCAGTLDQADRSWLDAAPQPMVCPV